jgi:hypothetical protein
MYLVWMIARNNQVGDTWGEGRQEGESPHHALKFLKAFEW